jgi:hypothetical protein
MFWSHFSGFLEDKKQKYGCPYEFHEDIWESVGRVPLILNRLDGDDKSAHVQVNTHFSEGKRILKLAGSEPRLLVCSAHTLVTKLAAVCQCTIHT